MKDNFTEQFGRLITASITPFDSQLKLDLGLTENLLQHLIANGTDSVVISGTTGENPTLSHAEEWQLLSYCQEKYTGKLPIIFGAGSNSTSTAIEAAKEASKRGADALLLVAPYYNKPGQEGMYRHFASIAEATDKPLMLYNNPGRTGSYIQPSTIIKLHKKYPHICALKESASPQALETIITLQEISATLAVYCGDDALSLAAMACGAHGLVSVSSHLIGSTLKEMIAAFWDGKLDKAAGLQGQVYPLMQALFAASSPSPVPVKYLLHRHFGIGSEEVRLPLTKLPEQERRQLDAIWARISGSALAK